MQKILKIIDDVLFVAGAALIVYGVALLSVPAAWITAGGFCLAFGVLVGFKTGRAA